MKYGDISDDGQIVTGTLYNKTINYTKAIFNNIFIINNKIVIYE